MIRNLCKIGLSVAGRQNEMIELALTNGFRTIEIDMEDMAGRAESFGKEFACQFIKSCNVQVGVFQLPIDFGAADEKYEKALAKLESVLELAEDVEATRCYAVISPGNDELPFHENFEKQRTRITEVAKKLAEKNIQLGLALQAEHRARAGKAHQFICTAEEIITFVKTIGEPNVGLALDTFQWTLGGGSLDQLEQLNASQITDVRLSDLSSAVDKAKVTSVDRLLPLSEPSSICQDVYRWLEKINYEGTVAVCASGSQVGTENQQAIVANYKKLMDILSGEAEPAAVAEAADEVEEAEPVAAKT
jgi:sugar phosphate isomerase/epimerase